MMPKRNSLASILVGQSSLLRDGVAKILRSANFRVSVSVSVARTDRFLSSKASPRNALFLLFQAEDASDEVAEQISLIRKNHADGRIAVIADRYRLNELLSAFRAGANGYFIDVMACDVFIKSIELVMMGETVLPPAFLSHILCPHVSQPDHTSHHEQDSNAIFVAGDNAIEPQLSPREKQIVRCLVEGDSNKSIARKMDIAEATVKVHIKTILRKIRVHNRTQAAIWGMNNGWQPPTNGALAPPLQPEAAMQLATDAGASVAVKKLGASASPGQTGQSNHEIEFSRLERLVRDDVSPGTKLTARHRKH
jgi:DNA-binding NarL/FixJ family response regulator